MVDRVRCIFSCVLIWCVRSSQPVGWLPEWAILFTSAKVPHFKSLYLSCVSACPHGLVSCVVILDLSYCWIQTKDGRLAFSLCVRETLLSKDEIGDNRYPKSENFHVGNFRRLNFCKVKFLLD